MEHSVVVPNDGRVSNANLCEYTVPLHADAPCAMDVIFVEEHDWHVNPLGVKGVSEIAMVGVPPAIVNAIFRATGKRNHRSRRRFSGSCRGITLRFAPTVDEEGDA